MLTVLQLVIDILGYNIRPTDNIQVDEYTPNNSLQIQILVKQQIF